VVMRIGFRPPTKTFAPISSGAGSFAGQYNWDQFDGCEAKVA
jgi:hypothetical protein